MKTSRILIIIILIATIFLNACVPAKYKKGVDYDDYPEKEIPIYDDAIIFSSKSSDDKWVIDYGTVDGIDDVIEFYQDYFEDEDIILSKEEVDKDEYNVEGQFDEYLFEIEAEEASGEEAEYFDTVVRVRVDEAEKEKISNEDTNQVGKIKSWSKYESWENIGSKLQSTSKTVSKAESITLDILEVLTDDDSVTADIELSEIDPDTPIHYLASSLYKIELITSDVEKFKIKIAIPEGMADEDVVIAISSEGVPKSEYAEVGIINDFKIITPDIIEDGYAIVNINKNILVDQSDVTASIEPNKVSLLNSLLSYQPVLSTLGTSNRTKLNNTNYKLGYFKASTYCGIFDPEYKFSDGHFMIVNEGDIKLSEKDAKILLKEFEQVYDYFKDIGYSYARRSKWPIVVYIKDMSGNKDAEGEEHSAGYVGGYAAWFSNNDPDDTWIEINQNHIKDGYNAGKLLSTIAHEFFHFVQSNYEETTKSEIWLDEATATYYELQFNPPNTNLISAYGHYTIDGVIPNAENNTARNGYARPDIFTFLQKKYGSSGDVILQIYKNIDSGSSVISAITDASKIIWTWSDDFYTDIASYSGSKYSALLYFVDVFQGIKTEDPKYKDKGKVADIDTSVLPDMDAIAKLKPEDIPDIPDEMNLYTDSITLPGHGARYYVLDFSNVDKIEDEYILKLSSNDKHRITLLERQKDTKKVVAYPDNYDYLVYLDNLKTRLADGSLFMVIIACSDSADSDVDFSVDFTNIRAAMPPPAVTPTPTPEPTPTLEPSPTATPNKTNKSITYITGTSGTSVIGGMENIFKHLNIIKLNSIGGFSPSVDDLSYKNDSGEGNSDWKVSLSEILLEGNIDPDTNQGSCTISYNQSIRRTDRDDFEGPLEYYDEHYVTTDYVYDDTVSATGTISFVNNKYVFKMSYDITRFGHSEMYQTYVKDGTSKQMHSTVTDKSDSYIGDYKYYFTPSE